MDSFNLPDNVVLVISTLNNIDKITFVQILIAKLGVYKYLGYLIYFICFA